jgi:hypothetical protein
MASQLAEAIDKLLSKTFEFLIAFCCPEVFIGQHCLSGVSELLISRADFFAAFLATIWVAVSPNYSWRGVNEVVSVD